jgi:catechol-2,3-dioxygenase
MLAEGKRRGIDTRGPSDHGFIHSIYFRDPNGYVIELTAKVPGKTRTVDPVLVARATLDQWQAGKQAGAAAR